MDVRAHLQVTTLLVNEGSSRCGIHHDPPAPLPALIGGSTAWRMCEGDAPPVVLSRDAFPECALSPPNSPLASHAPMLAGVGGTWERAQKGGRLFLLDGLFDLEYGPCDVLLMDGRFAHGVTTLRDLPRTPHCKPNPLSSSNGIRSAQTSQDPPEKCVRNLPFMSLTFRLAFRSCRKASREPSSLDYKA